jgi:signal transduction histidine kinase
MMTPSTPPVRQEVDSSIAMGTPDELSSGDLAELMSAFTEVTTKLERTHAQLRSEVARLNTELHQANEALQRSRRLAALGEMAAGISHEIRNPLGSIRLYANMLDEDLVQLPEQQQIVQKIGRAVRGLDEIVGDVLTFAREMKVQWQECDASALIDAALELCCAETNSGVVRADLSTPSIELVCDPMLIQQALVNVIRNACDANRAAGGERIIIRVARRKIDTDRRPVEGILFSICDEGDGMPQEVVERMFNPFFTTRATGTGLGLAIVHRIIDAHGGKVEVKNNTERSGATVELHVPVKQALVVTRGEFVSRNEVRVVKSQLETAQRMG